MTEGERGTEGGADLHEERLGALLDEAETRARGDAGFDVEAFVDAHADFADELRELLPLALGLRAPLDARETERGRHGRFGPFELVRTLGYGGMGTVYLAHDDRLGRDVALKCLRSESANDERFLERFRREARATAQLSHENIVQLLDADEFDGTPYYTMRYVEGTTLEDWLAAAERSGEARRRRGGDSSAGSGASVLARSPAELGFADIAELVRALADAVAHAHDRGILHRDIKPANVMLDPTGRPLILDFGVCRAEGERDLTGTDFVGTLRYSAPEQLNGAADERSDVYGLGLILYELLTLRRVWRGKETSELVLAVRNEEPRRPARIDRAVPPDLETIARKAYAKLPEERYASASALARDLEAFVQGRPIAARPPSALYLVRLFAGRHRGLCATALVSLVAFAALGTSYVLDVRAERTRRLAEAYSARVAAAQAALALGETSSALHHLEEAPAELTDWCWRNLRARADQALETLDPWPDSSRYVRDIRVSPDGRFAAVAGAAGTVVLDVAARAWTERLETGSVEQVAWRPDGGALVALERPGRLVVQELGGADGPAQLTLAGRVDVVAWSERGILAGGRAGRVWRVRRAEDAWRADELSALPSDVVWIHAGP
ncbi:MAG: serine/threonine-protein kinase, partial [Planctomycetota bacterium]